MKKIPHRQWPPRRPGHLLDACARTLWEHLTPAIAAALTGDVVLTGVSGRASGLTRIAMEMAIAITILIAKRFLWHPSRPRLRPLPA